MKSRHDLVNIIRKTQTLVSVLIFFIVLTFFWNVTDFKIQEIQLSHWGGSKVKYGWVWNSVVVLLGITTLFNHIFFLYKHTRIKLKKIPYTLFSIVSLSLIVVGLFNFEQYIIHNIFAYIYFFLYPLSIFTMVYLNRKYVTYNEWLLHLTFSVIMIVLPLSLIGFFEGMAISEFIHSIIVSFWNIIIAFKIFID